MIPVLLFYSYFLTKMPLKEALVTLPNPFSFLGQVGSLKQFQLNQWILGFDQPVSNLLKLLQYFFVLIGVLGFIIHRLNVSVTGFEVIAGKTYTPAWTEVAVSLMLPA